jgi:hypothetical protein
MAQSICAARIKIKNVATTGSRSSAKVGIAVTRPEAPTFALVVRSRAVAITALVTYLNEMAGLAVGGVARAVYGAAANSCGPLFPIIAFNSSAPC